MVKEIQLPEISETVESGSVMSLLVSVGDVIKEGDSLLEIETDKAAVEVPSPAGGKITEIMISEGEDVAVGQTIMKVETEAGEESAAAEEPEEKAPPEKPAEAPAAEKPAAAGTPGAAPGEEPAAGEPASKAAPQAAPSAPTPKPPARPEGVPVPAAPSTRRLAREIGVDIQQVAGSGPGGRITVEDVKAHAKQRLQGGGAAAPAAGGGMPQPAPLPDFSRFGETTREPMSQVRKITADNTTRSWQTIPHVTQFDNADVTALEEFRQKFGKRVEKAGGKLTVTAMLLKIVARALETFPRFNASLDSQTKEIVYKHYVNVGVAVDTDRGLLVPVIKDVDRKSITDLALELADMAGRARSKKIKPDEMDGGNFTISNLGGIGGTAFTPVVLPPQVAILGVARSSWQPVYTGAEFEPRLILPLSLSYDHRVIDGADGARFLRWICDVMENPLYADLEGGSK
ncbi:MAG: branched-chain alpha-keto acid dehydrogenase subunit E2 [Spirochaetes bacterium]|jgi:pyruvate dehydrogenase E2 component (dihydrolipoamide acetyltransferase)|nr:branched-chain alpha-keto acid dehydrogenase subunit E2 [Spirochaetota bacterium]